MNAIIQSLSPAVCERIANGEQSIIVAKTAPKEVPFKDYMYCTKQGKIFFHVGIGEKEVLFYNPDEKRYKFDYSFELMGCKNEYTEDNFLSGKVIGEFVCDKVDLIEYKCNSYMSSYMINDDIAYTNTIASKSCLDYDDMYKYLGDKNGYGLHISELKIYDKPKELSEFNCRRLTYNGLCGKIYKPFPLARAPKSWQYVEEV